MRVVSERLLQMAKAQAKRVNDLQIEIDVLKASLAEFQHQTDLFLDELGGYDE